MVHIFLTLPVKGRASDHAPEVSALNARCAHRLIHSALLELKWLRFHVEDSTFPTGTDSEASLMSEVLALTLRVHNVPRAPLLDGRILLHQQDRADA